MSWYTASVYKRIIQSSLYQSGFSNAPKRNFKISSRNQLITKKLSIVKKSFPADQKESPVALETKDSSAIIKRLNWEFKQLYGPLQKPKTEYIKNNPITTNDYETLQKNSSYRTENLLTENTDFAFESSQSALEMVLNFPMVNRQPSNIAVETDKSTFASKDNINRQQNNSAMVTDKTAFASKDDFSRQQSDIAMETDKTPFASKDDFNRQQNNSMVETDKSTFVSKDNFNSQQNNNAMVTDKSAFVSKENFIRQQNNSAVETDNALFVSKDNFPLVNGHHSADRVKLVSKDSDFVSKVNFLREELMRRCGGKMPSVTRILDKTMPVESAVRLKRWRERMVAELGEEGFERYHKELLSRGSSLHAAINAFLSCPGEEQVDAVNTGHWRSLAPVFPQIRNVRLLEERIQHPFLCYQGVVDCFAQYTNRLVVIDWKTSKKSKTSLSQTFDNPLQIAAYVGALNYDSRLQYLVKHGLIVVAYETGQPATPLFIDEARMQMYWRQWLKRVNQYWRMVEAEQNGTTLD